MFKRINKNEFVKEFDLYNRSENFSVEGREELYEFLEGLCEDQDNILDVIAICCAFCENTIKGVLDDYGLDSLEELEENTIVLKLSGDKIIYEKY